MPENIDDDYLQSVLANDAGCVADYDREIALYRRALEQTDATAARSLPAKRSGRFWSQQEGLLLFLLLDRFDPGWKSARLRGGRCPTRSPCCAPPSRNLVTGY